MLDSILQLRTASRAAGIAAAASLLALSFSAHAQSSGTVRTLGGTGTAGYVNGTHGNSQFSTPTGIAFRSDGVLFIADYGNNAVRTLRLQDTRAETFINTASPVAVAFDSSTNLFVASQSGAITKYDFFGNQIPGFGVVLSGSAVTALAIDREDSIYAAQQGGKVTRISPQGSISATLSAPGTGPHDFRGVAVADDASIYVSDAAAHVIWKFVGPGAQGELFAGTLYTAGRIDGQTGVGRLNTPYQIAIGPNNSIIVADRGNQQVRAVSCEGVIIRLYGMDPASWTYANSPEVFPGWYDSTAEFSEVREPYGVAADRAGNVFDTEVYYHLVREGTGLNYPAACSTGGVPVSTNEAPTPVLQPSSGYYPNGVTVYVTASNSITGFSRETHLYYTLDGTPPTKASLEIPIGGDGRGVLYLAGPVDLAGLRVRAYIGDIGSSVASATVTQVPVPVLSPASGYYPMGARIQVASTNGFPEGTLLTFTTDGSEPTTNSTALPIDANGGTIEWNHPGLDLRSLRVKAFLGPNSGRTIQGRAVSFPGEPTIQGEVGIPPGRGELYAGIGSFYMLPVVVNLRDTKILRSVQFVIEVTPLPGSPRLERTDVQVLPVSTNDFVQVLPASYLPPDDSFPVISADGTARLSITYFGTNSGFNVSQGYAAIALLGIQFRTFDSRGNIAEPGDGYAIRVTNVSGTSDGFQAGLPLKAMPDRTIHFKNIQFREGDTAPAFWYNAGDFGDDILDNSDVNNSIFAAFGFRRPFPRTDAFAAMDVYRIGVLENVVEYNDAATILRRSLGFESADVFRMRDDEGLWNSTTSPVPPPPASVSALSIADARVWNRDATIYSGIIDRVDGSAWVDVPIYMKVASGRSVSGMQFVADVVPENGAPAVDSVSFTPSAAVKQPRTAGANANKVYAYWIDIDPGLAGTVQLGTIHFQVPNTAHPGQDYAIVIHDTGGAAIDPNSGALHGYVFESIRGGVWPYVAHTETARVSDEWKAQFFGTAATAASEPDADADGDGFTNFEEYLAGSDPTAQTWHIRTDSGNVHFRWVGQAGKNYTVEQTSDFKGWNAVTGQISGQDAFLEYNESAPSAGARFYRLRVE